MRFLLALLIACLAVPAVAAPHCAEPVSGMGMDHGRHHGAPTPAKAMPAHECIGCIPPTFGLSRVAAPTGFVLALDHVQANAPVGAALHNAPDTPPPKILS